MSLWDVDKNSDSRTHPTLNQSDQVLQRMANGTTSFNPVSQDSATNVIAALGGTFRIIQSDTLTINPFSVAANSSGSGTVTVDFNTNTADYLVVLGFTPSLPSGGLFLWQGVSPESVLTNPSLGTMTFNVYIRFDTIVTPGTGVTPGNVEFIASMKNGTGSTINNGGYDITYYVLQQTS